MTVSLKQSEKATTTLDLRRVLLPIISCALTLIALQFYADRAFAQGVVNVEISNVGDAANLVFKGLNNWKYDLAREKSRQGDLVVLRLPPLNPAAVNKLKAYSDSKIRSIEVNESGVDGNCELRILLTDSSVDFFDYQTDQPNDLVVDFFIKEAKPSNAVAFVPDQMPSTGKSDAPVAKPVQKAGQAKKKSTTDNKDFVSLDFAEDGRRLSPEKEADGNNRKRVESVDMVGGGKRKPASDLLLLPGKNAGAVDDEGGLDTAKKKSLQRGIFDAADPEYKRFAIEDFEIKEESKIASRGSIYLRLPMLKLRLTRLDKYFEKPPVYEIEPNDSEENKEIRLLLTLFKNNRPALFLKTAKYFQDKYPKTKYDEILRYMIADTHMKMWNEEKDPLKRSTEDFNTAMGIYKYLTERYPESPMTNRTLLLLAHAQLERGNSLAALRSFEDYVRLKPESRAADQIKVAMADAYIGVSKYDEASRLLNEVETTAKNPHDRMEAAYRRGDIFFQKKDYAEAVTQYRSALKKYPNGWEDFPNAYFNMGEASFWINEHKDSLNSYRQFLAHYPKHEAGGYAMTRIGELLDIMGADSERVTGAYLESTFRYKNSSGAALARIRLLTRRMPEMRDKELKTALQELNEIVKTNPDLIGLQEFVTFSTADGYYKRKDFVPATKELVKYYQDNPTAANRGKFLSRIVRNITEDIRTQVDKGNFLEALKINGQYATSWLKNNDRIDTDVYVGRAYEQAGVYTEASHLYREALNRLYSILGTSKEKERNVFEVLPKADELNLRLAYVAAQEKDFAKAYDYLKQIKDNNSLTEAEQIQRAEVSVDVAEARGQFDVAQTYLQDLVATWRGQPEAVAGLYLRLAKLQIKNKASRLAETSLTKILNLQNDTGLVADDIFAEALEQKADLLVSHGKREEAVQTYKQLLDAFEAKKPMASVRYKAGQVLFENGDLKGAENFWADLKTDQNDGWAKLAGEKLQSARWQKDYKKYIDRIPAMQGMNEKGSTTK